MSVHKIAARYAKSLIDLAVELDKLDRVAGDITHFDAVTGIRDFKLLLKSPIINADKKEKIFKILFEDKYDELSFSFLKIILRKHREGYLPEIADAFLDQYDDIRKISRLKLITAAPLNNEQLDAIKDQIRKSGVTHPNIELETEVNPDIIGGFVLDFEDKLFDASLVFQLDQMRKELTTKKS